MNIKKIWELIVGPDEGQTVINNYEINRFEYIDQTGRVVVKYLNPTEVLTTSVQDEGRTLKVFVNDKLKE